MKLNKIYSNDNLTAILNLSINELGLIEKTIAVELNTNPYGPLSSPLSGRLPDDIIAQIETDVRKFKIENYLNN
jgi:hypothetical protein